MPRGNCAMLLLLLDAIGAASQTTTSKMALCSRRTVLTSDCASVCPDHALCTRFRTSYSASVDRSSFSDAFNVDSSGCVFRCMVSTIDPVRRIVKVHLSGDSVDIAEDQRDGSKVEDIAALTLPQNVTGLEIVAVGNTPQRFGYPDGNIVANGTQLDFLGLEYVASSNLPVAVYQLPISSLVLKSSEGSFPSTASNFKNLSTLVLDGCALTDFPTLDVLRDMPQVQSLSLTGNQIAEITVTLSTRDVFLNSTLRRLEMGENQLSAFDVVLPELEELSLNGNQLTTLPSSLWGMPKLRELRVDCNPLNADQLIDQLSTAEPLAAMQLLNLSGCDLEDTTLHVLARVFTNLSRLDVALNGLAQVRRDDLSAKTLQYLNISGNNLTFFNASFARLQVLDLSFNRLAGFESGFTFSSSLQILNISGNGLQSLPATPPSTITEVNASLNELTVFLTSPLPDLRVLDLSHNKLTQFPSAAVWGATNLKVLRLDDNPNMASFNVTPEQFRILESLSDFKIDASVTSGVGCPSDWMKSTHGILICVLPEISSSDGSNATTATDVIAMATTSSSHQGAIITTVVLVIAGVLFGIGACWHSRWRQQKAIDSHTQRARPASQQRPTRAKSLSSRRNDHRRAETADPLVNIWNDSLLLDLRVEMETVRFVKVIGSGAYGQVWRGMCRSPTIHHSHVAIKTLPSDLVRDRHVVKRFVAEIKLQASLVHPRIVEIVAVAWTSLSDLCVLMEFMPRGDLFGALHHSSSVPVSSSSSPAMFQLGVWGESKLQIALDIVDVLAFAHALSPVVIHRDLTSRNVLLDIYGRAKVADFRIARTSSIKNATAAGNSSPWWIAPEVILGKADYDEKSDVYSFGVILSELDTHETPYSAEIIDTTVTLLRSTDTAEPIQGTRVKQLSSRDKTNRIKATARRHTLHQIATGGLRPQFSSSCPRAIRDIAQRCLASEPDLRPSAVDLNYLLRRVEMDGEDVRVSILV